MAIKLTVCSLQKKKGEKNERSNLSVKITTIVDNDVWDRRLLLNLGNLIPC